LRIRANRIRWTDLGSFVAGAFDSYVLVGSRDAYACVQANFTLLGLCAFLGHPVGPLANRVVPIAAVLGRFGDELTEQLSAVPTWDARFALLDRTILARIDRNRHVPPIVRRTYNSVVQHRGRVAIRSLVEEAGCSQRHLIAQFNSHIGLTPKVFARILRFGRAAEMLTGAQPATLADIALACGYYDQAHFARDFRAFAGVSATELLASQLPDRGGFDAHAT
jgi:AraC-like DNA-binding protein